MRRAYRVTHVLWHMGVGGDSTPHRELLLPLLVQVSPRRWELLLCARADQEQPCKVTLLGFGGSTR